MDREPNAPAHRTSRQAEPRPRTIRPAALGMLFGIVVGGGVASVMFAVSMDPLWFLCVGIGTAVGLLTGAAVEARRGDRG